jgi:hypothetical protein
MDSLCLFGDVRRGSTDTATIDYVIDCHYDTDVQRLFMLSGSNEYVLGYLVMYSIQDTIR